jgi:probable O-glycosylation ligase (exosortase A-associated)
VIKLALLLLLTCFGVVGSVVYAPFIPVAVYYFYAVLRPQFLWEYSLSSYVSSDFPWSFILAGTAIATALIWRAGFWLSPTRFHGVRLPRFTIGHYLLGLFALWIAVTYITAERIDVAEVPWDEYRKIFLMFFIASLVTISIRQLWALYLIVAFSLIYISWEVNEIYFTNGGYNFLYNRGFCGLDNNGAALLLAMGIPLCVYAWDGIRHWSRWFFPIGIALIAHCVLLSYSRGAMLSLLITSPLYFFRCRNKKWILAFYAAGVLAVPFMASKEITDRFLTITKHGEDESANSRKTTWSIAWRMANEKPIFGFGLRNSSLYTAQYGADSEGRVIHNTYLQIGADSGLVGLGFYLTYLTGVFICCSLVRRRLHGNIGLVQYGLAVGHWLAGGRWNPHASFGRDDHETKRAYTIACGVEGALLTFAFGSFFLSMETFEPPYILAFLAAQSLAILKCREGRTETIQPANRNEHDYEPREALPCPA